MLNLLILGAGPAGCAAAISARARGLATGIMEITSRAHSQAGETLHPGVEPLLHQLGVLDRVENCDFHRHTGLWRVDKDGRRTFESYGSDTNGPWRGLQVDRAKFHAILRHRAISIGVNWTAIRALVCARRDHKGWVIETSTGQQIKASTVIDATGRQAWFASQLGLIPDRLCETQRVRFGWNSAGTDLTDGNPVFCEQEDGWEWNAPISQGRYAWVQLRRGDNVPGLDMTPRIYRECAGPDWFLIGDAACMTTPASGNGVLRALMSGIYAVHIYSATNSGALSCETGANVYTSWFRSFWKNSVRGAEALLHKSIVLSDTKS